MPWSRVESESTLPNLESINKRIKLLYLALVTLEIYKYMIKNTLNINLTSLKER